MDTAKHITKKSFSLVTAIVVLALTAAVIAAVFYFCGLRSVPRVELDRQMEVRVLRADNHLEAEDAAPLKAGDHLLVSATLLPIDRMDDAMLCFSAENCVVTAAVGGEERAVFGDERFQNKMQVGDLIARMPLKEEDWGKELTLDFFCVEGEAEASPGKVLILPSKYAAVFPLILKETVFILFLALAVAGTLLLMYSIVNVFRGRPVFEHFLLSFVLLSGAAFALGSGGQLAVLIRRERISSAAGIIAAYLFPAFFFAYYRWSCMEVKKIRKKVYGLFALLFLIAFGAALVFHFMQGTHFATFLPYLHYAASGAALYCLIAELFCGPPASRNDDLPAKIGIICASLLLLFDLASRNFYRTSVTAGFRKYIPSLDYQALAVLILCVFLMIHQYIRTAARVRKEESAELMKQLSYTDILSGIPNRHYCDRKLADLGKSVGFQGTPVDYTLFFMDVNSIREVNESKGYEVGDELIRCVAEAVSDAMRGCGADESAGRIISPDEETSPETKDCFYGRWGGDEFIACTFRSQADAFETTLMSRIAAINIEKRIPVDVSLSLGSCDLTSGSYDRVLESLVKADRAMYERKRQYHASHTPTVEELLNE